MVNFKHLLIALTGFFFITSCSQNTDVIKAPSVKNGQLDLSEWDFDKNGNVDLTGDWLFYYQQFLTASDIKNNTKQDSIHLFVPGIWNTDDKSNIKGQSYGTYYLHIKLPEQSQVYVLSFRDQSTAFRLFINDELKAEVGQIATSKDKAQAKLKSSLVSFYYNAEKYKSGLDIVFQVSNYHHSKGGLWSNIYLGKTAKIKAQNDNNAIINLIISGILFIMALYHFSLYVLNKRRVSTLLFGFFSLSMFIRSMATNDRIILEIFPNYPFELLMKTEYMSAFLLGIIIPLFIYFLFPKDYPKLALKIFVGFGIFTNLMLLVTRVEFYSTQKAVLNLQLFSSVFFSIFFVTLKAVIKKREGALLIFIGAVILMLTGVHDMLKAFEIVKSTTYFAPYGLVFFIFLQSYVLAKRFSNAFTKNIELTEKLNIQNQTLEERVKKRTSELNQQKEELQAQSEMLLNANESIMSQNEQIKAQNSLITDSINYAKSIQEAILPVQKNLDAAFNNFVIFKPKDIVSGDFYWYLKLERSDKHPEYQFLAVVDCTGHGVPGAFMSMIGNRLLNEIVKERRVTSPAEILKLLDEGVISALKQQSGKNRDGMDMSLCRLETKLDVSDLNKIKTQTQITFSGAKQNLYYFKKGSDTVEIISGDRRSIGGKLHKVNQIEFTNKDINLHKGDMFYLLSDGIIDQNNTERKRFGTPRLLNLLSEIHNLPVNEQKEIILKTLKDYMQDNKQRDDITVIGVRL